MSRARCFSFKNRIVFHSAIPSFDRFSAGPTRIAFYGRPLGGAYPVIPKPLSMRFLRAFVFWFSSCRLLYKGIVMYVANVKGFQTER
jgi:hypothetical protein